MDEEIKKKLQEFHRCNEEARKHFKAEQLIPGKPVRAHTEIDLMNYSKWRTKANILLNEVHMTFVEKNPGKLPWSVNQLEKENSELKEKLAATEARLKELGAE